MHTQPSNQSKSEKSPILSYDFFSQDNKKATTLTDYEAAAIEITSSKKWEDAKPHLSNMNLRLIETLKNGKAHTLSPTMQDYIPHALTQATSALKQKRK